MADRKETPDLKDLLQTKKGSGRPKEKKKYTKRTLSINDDLWRELEITAFVKYGKAGSVTLILHEAAREYLTNHPANLPDDPQQLKDLILKHARGPRRRNTY